MTMAHFGPPGKNPPWARNTSAQTAQLLVQATAQQAAAPVAQPAYNAGLATLRLAQVGLEQPCRENLFLVQPGVAIPTSLTATSVGNPGIALPTTLSAGSVATVSYPTPRSLHASQSQFQTSPQHQQQQQQQQQQQHSQVVAKQRVFTGTVSKLHENFGFVDDDVFFQITCVKGAMPKVGDRVLVEAAYNPNMPFKWNASRIQMLPNQVQSAQTQSQQGLGLSRPSMLSANPVISGSFNPQMAIALAAAGIGQPGNSMTPAMSLPSHTQQQPQSYNQVPPPQAIIHGGNINRLPSLMGTRRHSPPPPIRREREREVRRDDRRERERSHRGDREHERERVPVVRKRSRSPRPRSRSPPRRRPRIAPRYTVQVPKLSLDLKEANVLELRKRYTNMYVPSDFFFSSFVWMEAFPLYRPFISERPCQFHIMNKEVDPINENNAVLDPPDADHSFSAKVMLLSAPLPEELYQKCCGSVPADDGNNSSDQSFVHPTRLVNFLVGLKNKNETMAFGGPWSPSLDGADPRGDPSVLIRTAVRTCKGLTGIDLASCTKWYRFAEIYYHRRGGDSSSTHKDKGRSVAISSSLSASASSSSSYAASAVRVETVVIFLPDVWSCTPTLTEWDEMSSSYRKQLLQKKKQPAPAATAPADDFAGATAESKDNQALVIEESPSKDVSKKEPTHHSELDPKTMKIANLRQELEARNKSSKGLKSQLIARLTKALKAEHDKEEEEAESIRVEEEPAIVEEKSETVEKEEDKNKVDDADRQSQTRNSDDERDPDTRDKRNFVLPELPSLIVHPSRTAKAGRFDCTVMSLSVLLDYRPEDNKEHSFEVSLFAELFNEMLVRDYGFRIYRAIVEAPERKESTNNGAGAEVVIKDKKKEKKDAKKDDKKDSKEESLKKDDKKKKEEEDKEVEVEDEDDDDDDELEEVIQNEEEENKDKKKDDKERKKDSKERKLDDPYKSSRPIDQSLLLACVYFDQNHCGYIMDKDLEDILYTLGLNFSRAQTRKLLQNVLSKDKLLYLKLDEGVKPSKEIDQETETSALCDENKAQSSAKESVERTVSSLEELAAGNKVLLPKSRRLIYASGDSTENNPSVAREPPAVSDTGLVVYNGALLDIAKLLQQLQRSETARANVETSMKDMQEELAKAKELATIMEQTNQRTASELRDVKQRLRSTDDDFRVQQEKSHKYMRLLRDCHDIIHSTIVVADDEQQQQQQHRHHRHQSDSECTDNDRTKPEGGIAVKKEPLENGNTKMET